MKKAIIVSLFLGSCVWGMGNKVSSTLDPCDQQNRLTYKRPDGSIIDLPREVACASSKLKELFEAFDMAVYEEKQKRDVSSQEAGEQAERFWTNEVFVNIPPDVILSLFSSMLGWHEMKHEHQGLSPAGYVKFFVENRTIINELICDSKNNVLWFSGLLDRLKLPHLKEALALRVAIKIKEEGLNGSLFKQDRSLCDLIAKYRYLRDVTDSFVGLNSNEIETLSRDDKRQYSCCFDELVIWEIVSPRLSDGTVELENLSCLDGIGDVLRSNQNIKHVSCTGGRISEAILDAPNSPIVDLDLSHNYVASVNLNLPRLQGLILHHNKLQNFSQLPVDLVELDLSNNWFIEVPACIRSLCNLHILHMKNNAIDEIPENALPKTLITLDMSGNRLKKLTPLTSLSELVHLNVSKNQIGDEGVRGLTMLGKLQVLNLSGNNLSEEIIQTIQTMMPHVEKIDVSNMKHRQHQRLRRHALTTDQNTALKKWSAHE